MARLLIVLGAAMASLLVVDARPVAAQGGTWVKIEGQVVWPKGTEIPKPEPLKITADQNHCGQLNSEEIVINEKNRGFKNVWVYLRPDDDKDLDLKFPEAAIKPELLKPTAKTHDVDQPKCAFEPRIFAIRDGDFVNFKNSSPVAHNTKLDADVPSPSYNKTIPPKGNYKDDAPFKAQRSYVRFSCSIHPWMSGMFMVFSHPYYAVTDADGKFTIPDAPSGKYRIVYHHENGKHGGKEFRYGLPIEIKADASGKMVLDPLEFQLPPKK